MIISSQLNGILGLKSLTKQKKQRYVNDFDKDIRSIVKKLKLFTVGNSNTLLDGPGTIPEIKRAAKKLKNNKACGKDLINNEMI